MSFEPSQEDMLRADPNLGKQIIEQELAAVGKTIATPLLLIFVSLSRPIDLNVHREQALVLVLKK